MTIFGSEDAKPIVPPEVGASAAAWAACRECPAIEFRGQVTFIGTLVRGCWAVERPRTSSRESAGAPADRSLDGEHRRRWQRRDPLTPLTGLGGEDLAGQHLVEQSELLGRRGI